MYSATTDFRTIFIVLLILKLMLLTDLSWWWVVSPLLVGVVANLLVHYMCGYRAQMKHERERKAWRTL